MNAVGQPHEIQPHALKLLTLTSGTWNPEGIRSACMANEWKFGAEHPEINGYSFFIESNLRLLAVFQEFPAAPAPHCHVLLYMHAPANYPGCNFPMYAREDFRQAFETSLDSLEGELGNAEVYGVHEIGWAPDPQYAYAIWRSQQGLLVLQQGEFDLYSGEFSVSVYLHPWKKNQPAPRLPLAVWGRT